MKREIKIPFALLLALPLLFMVAHLYNPDGDFFLTPLSELRMRELIWIILYWKVIGSILNTTIYSEERIKE